MLWIEWTKLTKQLFYWSKRIIAGVTSKLASAADKFAGLTE